MNITSAELREIERRERAKARADAETTLLAIRRGEFDWMDADAGYRIRINVTLCPWGEEDSYTYQLGLDTQRTSDIRPTLGNLRDLATPDGVYQPTSVTLCLYWYIEATSTGEDVDPQSCGDCTVNVTVWSRADLEVDKESC